ncbi:DinB family protein [Ferruginibacter sp. SUN106]|uniref:DinB family protein n=1 Tax=Ferruginibacter sp. SUN106 TaxID=2978348 RepID=UPI003D35DAEB
MNTDQIIIKMLSDRWHGAIKNFDTAMDAITDEQLQKEIAPGKNRGIYLLGHLIAVHDDMLILLGLGDKMYPELNEPFIKSPDKAIDEIPSAQVLRNCWNKQKEFLTQQFNSLQPVDWFQKHTAVTAEDFIKEPHRNKLNILLTRTTHLTYHTGQLVLLK